MYLAVLNILLVASLNVLFALILYPPKNINVQASPGVETVPRAKNEIFYVSNEILVKLKDSVKGKVGANSAANAQGVGIKSFDALNKKHKAKSVEKVFRESKKGKSIGAAQVKTKNELGKWVKITLDAPKKALKDDRNPREPDFSDLTDYWTEDGKQYLDPKAMVEEYLSDPNVEAAEVNYYVSTNQTVTPNDPYYGSRGTWGQAYDDLWGIKKINSAGAWQTTTGSSSVVVADIDTGVDRNHEDLSANMWTNTAETPGNGKDDDLNGYIDDYFGWDFVNNDGDPMDDNGHGTHTAGTIGAVGNNAVGVVGVSWNTKIMAVKFLDSGGSGSSSAAASAVRYATDNGARITSNSWGCACSSGIVDDAIKYAHTNNVVTIVAAGNSAEDAYYHSPANVREAITVSATDVNDKKANFSNFGPKIDVGAPGVDILSLKAGVSPTCVAGKVVGNSYCRLSGTSMATPHVSGLAALIISKNPTFTNEQVRQVLREGSNKVLGTEFDYGIGYGLIDPPKAVNVTGIPSVLLTTPKMYETLDSSGILNVKATMGLTKITTWNLTVGLGLDETTYKQIAQGTGSFSGLIASVPVSSFFVNSGYYTLRIEVEDSVGAKAVDRSVFIINGSDPQGSWPKFYSKTAGSFTDEFIAEDLDGDNVKEIIGTFNNYVHVWRKDGSIFAGWPKPLKNAADGLSVGDVLGDTKPEIVVAQNYTINVFDARGNIVAGWPKQLAGLDKIWCQGLYGGQNQPLTLADLDGDGKKEIVVAPLSKINDPSLPYWLIKGKIYAFKGDGSFASGFPRVLTGDKKFYEPGCGLAVGNVVGDSKPEIAFNILGGGGQNYFLLDNAGNLLPGWPKNSKMPVEGGTTVIVDIDGDGSNEIIFGNEVFDANGHYKFTLVDSSGSAFHTSGVVVGDIGSDSEIDIVSNYYEIIAGKQGGKKEYLISDMNGRVRPNWPLKSEFLTCRFCDLKIADVTGDGKNELVTVRWGSLTSRIVGLDVNGNELYSSEEEPGFWVSSLLITDLENDGGSDFVITRIDMFGNLQIDIKPVNGIVSNKAWRGYRLTNEKNSFIGSVVIPSPSPSPLPSPSPSPSPTPKPSPTPSPSPKPAPPTCKEMDFTGDNWIDISDVLVITENYGSKDPKYDVNRDGKVDTADAYYVLGYFGKQC